MGRTPVVFSIDVEPHGFQLSAPSARQLAGCEEMFAIVERVRPALHDATGSAPSFGWYFRMDPQIAGAYGDARHLVRAFGDRIDRLLEAGDHFGAHTHLLRWSAPRAAWVHDIADGAWTRDCVETALGAYEDAFGSACTRHRSGAGLYTQELVDALDRGGVVVESGMEPLPPTNRGPSTLLDSTELVGRASDCSRAPRHPYHPMAGDFVRPGPRGGLTVLPLTTTRLSPLRPAWQSWGRWMVGRRRRPPVRCMHPWVDLPPTRYWDWVSRQLRTMRRPHANLAIRTNDPAAASFQRTRAILEALPTHPIASCIVLVDPLDVVAQHFDPPAAGGH